MTQSLLLIVLMFVGGCSSLSKLALRSQAPLFEKGGATLNRERDWQWFKEATPGNIQFMETMLSQDEGNRVLRRTLVKAYAGYAFAVFETEALPEQIRGDEKKNSQSRAIAFYKRALAHAEVYFSEKDLNFKETDEEKFAKELEKRLGVEDFTTLAFMAQAWGASINLQKQDMVLMSQLPRVKTLFDFVCQRQPDIENGLCPMFYAQYEASRPRLVGGNPVLGAELFQKFILKSPHNLLARVSYLQHSVITRLEEEEFQRVGSALEAELEKWERGEFQAPELNLYNAIAQKRWQLLKDLQKKIF